MNLVVGNYDLSQNIDNTECIRAKFDEFLRKLINFDIDRVRQLATEKQDDTGSSKYRQLCLLMPFFVRLLLLFKIEVKVSKPIAKS